MESDSSVRESRMAAAKRLPPEEKIRQTLALQGFEQGHALTSGFSSTTSTDWSRSILRPGQALRRARAAFLDSANHRRRHPNRKFDSLATYGLLMVGTVLFNIFCVKFMAAYWAWVLRSVAQNPRSFSDTFAAAQLQLLRSHTFGKALQQADARRRQSHPIRVVPVRAPGDEYLHRAGHDSHLLLEGTSGHASSFSSCFRFSSWCSGRSGNGKGKPSNMAQGQRTAEHGHFRTIQNIRLARAHGEEESEIAKLEEKNLEWRTAGEQLDTFVTLVRGHHLGHRQFSVVLILTVAAFAAMQSPPLLTIGEVTLFLAYFERINGFMNTIFISLIAS